MKILCVCHANVCRSFMAQEFLKKLLPEVTVFSRGLYADPSYTVPEKVKQALAQQHIEFTKHTATPLLKADLQEADLIFCMEKEHLDLLLDRYAQYTDKLWLLTDFAYNQEEDIPDPISLQDRAFAKQAQELYKICEAASKRIQHDFSRRENL